MSESDRSWAPGTYGLIKTEPTGEDEEVGPNTFDMVYVTPVMKPQPDLGCEIVKLEADITQPETDVVIEFEKDPLMLEKDKNKPENEVMKFEKDLTKHKDLIKFEEVLIQLDKDKTEPQNNLAKFEDHLMEPKNDLITPNGKPHHKQCPSGIKKYIPRNYLPCDQCDKVFEWKPNLDTHKLIHSGILCKICKKLYTSETDLAKHVCKTRITTKHICDLCDETFYHVYKLQIHKLTSHNPFFCKVCNNVYASDKILSEHVCKSSSAKKFECDLCDKKFDCIPALDSHKLIHSGTSLCKVCHMVLTSRALTEHVCKPIPSNTKKFQCGFCDKSFDYQPDLSNHTRIHSGNTGITHHKCRVCKKKFADKSVLKIHTLMHKRHICHVCGKKYRRKSTLTAHLLTHSEKALKSDVLSSS